MKNGEVGILNVGAGDTKLSFDPSKPAERKRAAKVVTEMLQRGYAIFVQAGEKDGEPLYRRAHSFDPETCEYLIVGVPDDEVEAVAPKKARRAAPRATVRVPAATTHAVSVARSAGG